MLERVRNPAAGYAAALVFLSLAIALRWAFDPWLDSRQPFATLYGAVALTVWVGGAVPALILAIAGYLLCDFFFLVPRGEINLDSPASYAGLTIYALSQLLIIAFGVGVRRAHARAEAVISVRDNGIGIDAEHLPDVFRMFSQVTPALDRAQGGLGIGLALVQGLAELHGGSIRAHSAGGGRGSEFVLRLPCLAQSDAPRQAESMGSAND